MGHQQGKLKASFILTLLFFWIGLPLLAAFLSGKTDLLNWPPRPEPVDPVPFSPRLFGVVLFVEILLYGMLLKLFWRRRWRWPVQFIWPEWGWLTLLALFTSWGLAWSEVGDFLKPLKFPLLWWSFICAVNAVLKASFGHAPLTERPQFLLSLALMSAPFWWLFELHNLFLKNWYYLGTDIFDDLTYTLHATLAFSTVLPAVASTYLLLVGLMPKVDGPRLRQEKLHSVSLMLLWLGGAALFLLPIFPNQLYPLVWIAPFLIFIAFEFLSEREGLLVNLSRGRWEEVALGALAGLICGFFWEMWNFWSDPKWRYAIPYLHRFLIFEMPLLGYAGYLPFGIGCIALASWWSRKIHKAPLADGIIPPR